MDWSNIVIAILALIGTLSGTIIGNKNTQNLLGYRIGELEKKVEKHNTVIERTYALEKDVAVLKKEMTDIKENNK